MIDLILIYFFMENVETVIAICVFITGAVTPLLISVLKGIYKTRIKKTLTADEGRILTAIIAFATTTWLLILFGDLTWQGFSIAFPSIIGISQIVYFTVIKTLKIDELLEE